MAKVPQKTQTQTNAADQTQKSKERLVLRIEWILIPLVLLVLMYLGQGRPVLTWDRVMDYLNVHDKDRYTMLFHLGLIVIGVVAVAKILGSDKHK